MSWLESTRIRIALHVSCFLKQERVHSTNRNKKTNPLGIINTLLTLLEPNELIGWLSSNAEENRTKLIKFIVAVRDKYNKLVVDYNQLQSERNDELLASKERDNTREAKKQRVIHYLQSQVADLTAENDTFRRLQEQAIVNPPGNNGTSGTIDHKPSPDRLTSLVNTSTKRCFKLQDPPVFIDKKENLPVEYSLAKMKAKIKADGDLMNKPEQRIAYVMNCVKSMAFGHLEPRF